MVGLGLLKNILFHCHMLNKLYKMSIDHHLMSIPFRFPWESGGYTWSAVSTSRHVIASSPAVGTLLIFHTLVLRRQDYESLDWMPRHL